jgi:hypothetical protein
LLDAAGLAVRRGVITGPLAPLAGGLRTELAPLLEGRVEIPAEKALLSRTGGRCPRDGTYLGFDPLDARHRCVRCGLEVTGELHDRFRPYWYQLWLAERVVHAATLGVLLDDRACIGSATRLLEEYANRYLDYPNRDNVLGPSRPFFSTYLESIWLLQLSLALDLLESGGGAAAPGAVGAIVRERLIAPSAQLIASYDEGMSNRQVWNNAALIAAGSLLGRPRLVERAIEGSSGLLAHLERALLEDGSWYEGENYHLFAHRGLWYAVTIAERLGWALPVKLGARFDVGFASPFRTLLPDLTYPSRRDSQYAVSVRQPRFAESCELGLARREDARLVGMLARLYDPSVPRTDTGRAASTADVERNLPATGLTRADLSWRSLLFARAELPPLEPVPMQSDLLPGQGLGILRRDEGRVYVALDYGHSGGGHGHPDRLNVLLSDGATRWFDDPGTGSYVEESLHWYRSTLAHTAPIIDGRSQPRVHGELIAFDDARDASWIMAQASLAEDLTVSRAVVALDHYLVDTLGWSGDALVHDVALPFHGVHARALDGSALEATPAPIDGATGREDGFSFLRDTARLTVPSDGVLRIESASDTSAAANPLRGWLFLPPGSSCWSATAPGVPGGAPRPMILARATVRSGFIVGVWSWRGAVVSASSSGSSTRVVLRDGVQHVHDPGGSAWRITMMRGDDRRVIELGGWARNSTALTSSSSTDDFSVAEASAPLLRLPAHFVLGREHYRRSEQSWDEAGRPSASVSIEREPSADAVTFTIDVPHAHRRFVPIDAENPFDNEPMAINGDGVQLYVHAGEDRSGWLLVPIAGTEQVSVRAIEAWSGHGVVRAEWTALGDGYRVVARIALSPNLTELAADVIVNESSMDRVRRRGQLVMSGASEEFVYLRGDRHEPERLFRFSLAE